MGQAADIDAACRYIRRDQDPELLRLETVDDPGPLCLCDIAVKGLDGITAGVQIFREIVHIIPGAAEHHGKKPVLHVDQTGQSFEPVLAPDLVIDLIGQIDRQALRLRPDNPVSGAHEFFRDFQNRFRHRRGKHQHAFLPRGMSKNRLDFLYESHIQHFIRLVQHGETEGPQIQSPPVNQILYAPGRPDGDVQSGMQTPQLNLDRLSSVQRKHLQFPRPFQGIQFLRCLKTEFPCRRQNQRSRIPRSSRKGFQNRQAEGRRLSRPRLRLTNQIPLPGKKKGNGLLLYRSRLFKTFETKRFQERFGNPESTELC